MPFGYYLFIYSLFQFYAILFRFLLRKPKIFIFLTAIMTVRMIGEKYIHPTHKPYIHTQTSKRVVYPKQNKDFSTKHNIYIGKIQKLLGEEGYYQGLVDNHYGPSTHQAIHRFATQYDLVFSLEEDWPGTAEQIRNKVRSNRRRKLIIPLKETYQAPKT